MNKIVDAKEVRKKLDEMLSKNCDDLDDDKYNSLRALMHIAISINKNIKTNNRDFDEYYRDYPRLERHVAKFFNMLRKEYKGKIIAIESLDRKGELGIRNMESQKFIKYAVDNLEASLAKRGIRYRVDLLEPDVAQNNDDKMTF